MYIASTNNASMITTDGCHIVDVNYYGYSHLSSEMAEAESTLKGTGILIYT